MVERLKIGDHRFVIRSKIRHPDTYQYAKWRMSLFWSGFEADFIPLGETVEGSNLDGFCKLVDLVGLEISANTKDTMLELFFYFMPYKTIITSVNDLKQQFYCVRRQYQDTLEPVRD